MWELPAASMSLGTCAIFPPRLFLGVSTLQDTCQHGGGGKYFKWIKQLRADTIKADKDTPSQNAQTVSDMKRFVVNKPFGLRHFVAGATKVAGRWGCNTASANEL